MDKKTEKNISKDEMKQWLDKLVDDIEIMRNHVTFSNEIRTFEPDNYVLMYGAIEAAEIMGIPYEVITKDGKKYKMRFTYRDIDFISFFDEV